MASSSRVGSVDRDEPLLDGHGRGGSIQGGDVNFSLEHDLTLKQSIVSKQSIFEKYFGKTSIKGAIFNLIVAIVGAGILSFPFAIRSSGLLLGLGLLVL